MITSYRIRFDNLRRDAEALQQLLEVYFSHLRIANALELAGGRRRRLTSL